jgi:tetratricopeptide (TPR) repeat protein
MGQRGVILALSCLVLAGASRAAPPPGPIEPASPAVQRPADADARRQAFLAYREGQDALARERWAEAEAAFTRAIKLEPLLTVAHYGLGQAYMGLRRYPSAVRAYTACLEAAQALHHLAFTDRAAADRQIDEEMRELRESIRRIQGGQVKTGGPQMIMRLEQRLVDLERMKSSATGPFRPPAEVLLALGSAHFRNGDLASAEARWTEAISVSPSLGEAHNNLAVIYLSTGRVDEAHRALALAERHGFRVNPGLKADVEKARGGRP